MRMSAAIALCSISIFVQFSNGCATTCRESPPEVSVSTPRELLGAPVASVAIPSRGGVSVGCAMIVSNRKLLLTSHQIRKSAGRIFVGGRELSYQIHSTGQEDAGPGGWTIIEVDDDVDFADGALQFDIDFDTPLSKGTLLYTVWFPQTIESFAFPIEYHLDELNVAEIRVTESIVLDRPGYPVDGDYEPYILFRPALESGASGAGAFRWNANRQRWILVGIVSGVMQFQADPGMTDIPDPIGLMVQPGGIIVCATKKDDLDE